MVEVVLAMGISTLLCLWVHGEAGVAERSAELTQARIEIELG